MRDSSIVCISFFFNDSRTHVSSRLVNFVTAAMSKIHIIVKPRM